MMILGYRTTNSIERMVRLLTSFLILHVLQSSAITVTISGVYAPSCDYSNGRLFAYVTGGMPPYQILWNTGTTTAELYDIPAGTYSVTVTDANLDQASDTYVLMAVPLQSYGQFIPGCVNEDLQLGPPYRMLAQATSPVPGEIGAMGVGPITLGNGFTGTLLSHSSGYTFMSVEPPMGDWTTSDGEIPFTDGTGCTGVLSYTIPETPGFPSVQLLSVQGSCTDASNGSIELYVGQAPNQWAANLELVRDGTSLGLVRSAYSTNTTFGQSTETVIRHDLAPGEYMVITTMVAPDFVLQEMVDTYFGGSFGYCNDTLFFSIPDLGYPCGTLFGEVFMDDDLGCTRNGSEPRLPSSILEIQPGGIFTMSDAFGRYWAQLPFGDHTVEQLSNVVTEHCVGAPIPFELSVGDPIITVPIPDTSLVARDVSIAIGSGPARPGSEMNYGVRVENLTPGTVTSTQVTVTFDPTLTYVSATPTPTSISGNTVSWNLGSIGSFLARYAQLRLAVPADVGLIGTDLEASTAVTVAQAETDLSNNNASTITTITGSYDPNDKQAFTVSNNEGRYMIAEDSWIDYTIRFQNTGTDTAFFVVITDTLPGTLDPGSMVPGGASHAYMIDLSGHGILRISIPNILLPDSNANEAASHGFVSFRIKPREPVLPGTVIENTANIYFDFNPPVITEPSVLVAEFSTGVGEGSNEGGLRLYPNPAEQMLNIELPGTSGSMQIEARALDGRLVASTRSQGPLCSLSVAHLSAGLYSLQVTSTEGRIYNRLFIKQ